MFGDSGGGNKNGADDLDPDASRDLRRATYLLRLLKSSDEESIADPDIQQEFQRLHELLERIDSIAERVEGATEASESPVHSEVAQQTARSGDDQPADIGAPGDDSPTSEPMTNTPSGESAGDQRETPEDADEGPARWWVNFNGDVSLERLSRLRALLDESPFTIDTRYDEITDGLIVLRVVTDQHITMDQMNWLLQQLMDLVELDRKSAIVSKL